MQEAELSKDKFLELCSSSAKDVTQGEQQQRAWCKIAESLPNRSVQSIHNFCRRKFNTDNYQGNWTEEEERALIDA